MYDYEGDKSLREVCKTQLKYLHFFLVSRRLCIRFYKLIYTLIGIFYLQCTVYFYNKTD